MSSGKLAPVSFGHTILWAISFFLPPKGYSSFCFLWPSTGIVYFSKEKYLCQVCSSLLVYYRFWKMIFTSLCFQFSTLGFTHSFPHCIFSFLKLFIYLFIVGCPWPVLAALAFLQSPRAGATLQLRCVSFSLQGLLLWWSSRVCAGSVVVAHRLSCPAACGIFPDQGLNPCLLRGQADS